MSCLFCVCGHAESDHEGGTGDCEKCECAWFEEEG